MAQSVLVQSGSDASAVVLWRGRSGRDYPLVGEKLSSFGMRDAHLYVLAKTSHVLWVGAVDDLVADANSRARFRLALDTASHVFRLDGPFDRPAAIWDLETAVPARMASPQAA